MDDLSMEQSVVAEDAELAFRELAHIVALSATNKRPEVLAGLIETLLAGESSPVAPGSLQQRLLDKFRLPVVADEVEEAWRRLVVAQRLVNGKDGLTLALRAKAEVAGRIEEADALGQRVRGKWLGQCHGLGLAPADDDKHWAVLTGYMAMVFPQHGVAAVALLTPAGALDPSSTTGLPEMFDRACRAAEVACDDRARAAVRAFFLEQDADRARYLAQLLDSTFTYFTIGTPVVARQYLRRSLQPLKLLLDTNTLYDLFDLDAVPGTTKQLVEFVKANNLPISLLVHERTVREFGHKVTTALDELSKRPSWSGDLSAQAVSRNPFVRAFHRANATTPVDPAAFLSKFNQLRTLIKPFGITVFDPDDTSPLHTEKMALLEEEYKAFLKEIRPLSPEKPYVVLEHDARVIVDARALRRSGDTALDSGALVVTNDAALYQFDARGRSGSAGLPVVALTSQLVQVLRPMGVPTHVQNVSFVRMFAPELRTAHSDFEETRAKVYGYLTAHEHTDPETAAAIMGNELLLIQAKPLDADDPRLAELIDSAVFEENVRLRHLAEQVEAEASEARQQAVEAANNAVRLQAVLDQARAAQAALEHSAAAREAQLLADRAVLEGERQSERETTEQVTARLNALETRLESERAHDRVVRRRRIIGVVVVVTLSLMAGTIWGPDHLSWMHRALKLHHRKAVQATTVTVWAALAVAVVKPAWRVYAITGVVIGAVFTLIQLIGS